MDFFWLIQNIVISLLIIGLFHYIYVYMIDNFTELKIKDPEILHTNYNEIIDISNNQEKIKTVTFEQVNHEEQDNFDRNMEEELKQYLQQQIDQQLN